MWHDFDAIPEAPGRREGAGSRLTRLYHDIALAAVADALGLAPADLDADLAGAIGRGAHYLVRPAPSRVGLAA